MTTVDARLAADDFDMSDGGTINYASFNYQTSDRMFLQWNTGNGDVIDAYGGPVYLDGTQFPDHGPVNLLKIDLGGDGDPNTGVGIDVIITPSAPVGRQRSSPIPVGSDPGAAADEFWATLLSGDDVLYASNQGNAFMFGDFRDLRGDDLQRRRRDRRQRPDHRGARRRRIEREPSRPPVRDAHRRRRLGGRHGVHHQRTSLRGCCDAPRRQRYASSSPTRPATTSSATSTPSTASAW